MWPPVYSSLASTAAEASTVGRRIEGAVEGLAEGLGVSHGAAEWPQDGPTKEMVLLRADVALYAAKRRNGDGTGAPASPAGPATEGTPAPITDLERAQLDSYARDVRDSYVRELRRTNELHESYLATVKTLAAAVEAKDEYTGGHIQRVLALGLLLARAVAPEDADDPQLTYGFLLHDIGKLAVPDAVLTKPGKLTDEEWALMREHPEAGARILANVPFLERALEVVLHHHERWDGGGYPHGLAGDDIPQWARIFAIVDTVDAITSDRPYRAGRPLAVAVEQVLDGAGTQFDPACARAFAGLDSDSVEALLQHRPDTDLRPRRAPERTAAGTPADFASFAWRQPTGGPWPGSSSPKTTKASDR
jgi:ribonuclease P protein subunit RPR2